MSGTAGVGITLWLIVIVACLALFVAWIILPFAIFGLKGLMRELLNEQRRTNALLERSWRKTEPPPDERPRK